MCKSICVGTVHLVRSQLENVCFEECFAVCQVPVVCLIETGEKYECKKDVRIILDFIALL